MDADGIDNEVCPLSWGAAVSLNIDCARGDYITFVQFTLVALARTITVVLSQSTDEATAWPQVEFDAPLAAAFTEVEAVAVDFSGPLFGEPPAMAAHYDIALARQPGLQVGFGGLRVGFDLLALWRFPDRRQALAPLLPRAAAISGVRVHTQSNP